MSDPFVAEIRIFAGNFAPRNWAFCNGQLLPIAQNTALFSLVGTIYGGDGVTVFALPNLQGRVPMHPGSGPGLTARTIGEADGAETVTLTEAQSPAHTHGLRAHDAAAANQDDPGADTVPGITAGGRIYGDPANLADMADGVVSNAGGGQPHTNLQPFLALNYIIALQGVYPSIS